MTAATTRFSGRAFSTREVTLIREVVRECSSLSRMELARTVCELLRWRVDTPLARTWSTCGAALSEQVAHAADLTKKRAAIIVDTLFGSIAEALHQGEKVEIRGFGSFRLRCRGPHRGRNPRTGDRVNVPLKRVAYFKPGRDLRELINRNPAAGLAGARVADVEPLLRRATAAAGGGRWRAYGTPVAVVGDGPVVVRATGSVQWRARRRARG